MAGPSEPKKSEDGHKKFRLTMLRGDLAVMIVGLYTLFGLFWIATTDRLLLWLAPTPEMVTTLQTNKGWFFVAITGLMLFLLTRNFMQTVRSERAAALSTIELMEESLAASGSGIWSCDVEAGTVEISPSLSKKLGLPADQPLTIRQWRGMIHPDDLHIAVAGWERNANTPGVEQSARHRILSRSGEELWLEMRGRGTADEHGNMKRLTGVAIDITKTRQAEERANEVANFDTLTGLPNQRKFREELERRLADLTPDGDHTLMVCRLDLDRFADINGALGVSGGDEILRIIGERLSKTCGGNGLVTRVAADEFGILLPSDGDIQNAKSDIRALAVAVRQPITFGESRLDITASIGVAVAPQDGTSAETLMVNADVALNSARNNAQDDEPCFYASGMHEDFKARALLARDLQTAIRNQSIKVFFQPIIRGSDRRLAGFEALARWHHPERGNVPPYLFIPLAEELGLISQITEFMMREACFHLANWNREFGHDWMVAVNLSGRELCSPGLHKKVASVLSKTGLAPHCLELEVTENALTENMEMAATNLTKLRELGVSLAIDDFGTGYSSLVALRRLPVSRLKIDRSFVEKYGVDVEDTAIVNSIIQLAYALDLELTAEGIEEEATFQQLRAQGCQFVQGYLFGRPESVSDTHDFLVKEVAEAAGGTPAPHTAGRHPAS